MAEAPYDQIADYMIRSAFSSAIVKSTSARERTFRKMTNADDTLLEEIQDDAKKDIPEWKKSEPRSIFNFTKVDPFHYYKWFHPKVLEEYKRSFRKSHKGEDPKQLKLDKVEPEGFQVVMVASDMLRYMFKEECLRNDFLKSIKAKKRNIWHHMDQQKEPWKVYLILSKFVDPSLFLTRFLSINSA